MIIHKCDTCQKEMTVWMEMRVVINAADDKVNVAQMIPYTGLYEICESCMRRMFPDRDAQ